MDPATSLPFRMRPRAALSKLLFASALVGCVRGAEAPCPAAAPALFSIPVPAEPRSVNPVSPAAASTTSLCHPDGRPSPSPAKQREDRPFCDAFDAGEISRVEAQVRKNLVVYEKPSRLVIDFGCDEAYGTTRELVFESGSGHGGSLDLVRLKNEGSVYRIRRISSLHYDRKRLGIEVAELPAPTVDALIEKTRVAMLAQPHFIRLLDPSGAIGLGTVSFTSNDFHLRLAIVDTGGRSTERSFTGYDSSMEQETIVPMRLATEPLEKLLSTAAFRPSAIEDEDREFFTAELVRQLKATPNWWVRERYLEIAKTLGTKAALPTLATLAAAPVRDGASEARTRELVIDAVAAISGWDPRRDEAGQMLSSVEAAAAVARECSPLSDSVVRDD